MATTGESSLPPTKNDKPVIVRVKRKSSQSCLDAFWLEINERPLKRALLDFDKLSISGSSSKVKELKSRKVLVRHVETVTSSEVTVDILQSFVSNSPDELESKGQNAEIRRTFKTENKQGQLLFKARQSQEVLSKNARFEQIWRSRRETKEFARDEAVGEMCRLYDIVRLDVEEKSNVVPKDKFPEVDDDCKMMAAFLPLLREVIPTAAMEVEADIFNRLSGASLDNYVYDFYAVKDDMDITEENIASPFPLVQVEDDDEYYDGPEDFEYESDDSNAENNPLNDYPDEESSDFEDVESSCTDENKDTESRCSGDSLEEKEEESGDGRSFEDEEEEYDWSGGNDILPEDGIYDDDIELGEIDDMYADDDFSNED